MYLYIYMKLSGNINNKEISFTLHYIKACTYCSFIRSLLINVNRSKLYRWILILKWIGYFSSNWIFSFSVELNLIKRKCFAPILWFQQSKFVRRLKLKATRNTGSSAVGWKLISLDVWAQSWRVSMVTTVVRAGRASIIFRIVTSSLTVSSNICNSSHLADLHDDHDLDAKWSRPIKLYGSLRCSLQVKTINLPLTLVLFQ